MGIKSKCVLYMNFAAYLELKQHCESAIFQHKIILSQKKQVCSEFDWSGLPMALWRKEY